MAWAPPSSAAETGQRQELYARCQREGVGISVMKPFCGGQLLDAQQSPFGAALTPYQCLQYALDKPGVMTVLPGIADRQQLRQVLGFLEAPAEQRDYSAISGFAPADAMGKCVYCKHCHPCPAGLDVALINKRYDLSRLGDGLAREHYLTLEKQAGDCVGYGHCDGRCPFHVAEQPDAGNSVLFRGIITKNRVPPGGKIGSLRAARFPAGFLTNGAVSVIIGPMGKFNSRAGRVRGG